MKHSVFGEIEYTYMWVGDCPLKIFGVKQSGVLNVSGESDEKIDSIQEKAFIEFKKKEHELVQSIEIALFEYYNHIVLEYRDRYGEDADNYAPIITSKEELGALLRFEAVNLPYSFVEEERIVGVLFKARWEPSHGVAVKLINEEITEIGFQDIIL